MRHQQWFFFFFLSECFCFSYCFGTTLCRALNLALPHPILYFVFLSLVILVCGSVPFSCCTLCVFVRVSLACRVACQPAVGHGCPGFIVHSCAFLSPFSCYLRFAVLFVCASCVFVWLSLHHHCGEPLFASISACLWHSASCSRFAGSLHVAFLVHGLNFSRMLCMCG